MVDDEIVHTGGRILGAMAVIGLGIALAAILTAEWISATVIPTLGPAAEEVVTAYTPLAFLSIAALAAPVVAGIVGIFEGGRSGSQAKKHVATVAVACLAGAVVLVLIAGVGVALSDPSGQSADSGGDNGNDTDEPDDTDNDTNGTDNGGAESGDGGIGPLDLFGLAGLCGIGGLVTGGLTTAISPD